MGLGLLGLGLGACGPSARSAGGGDETGGGSGTDAEAADSTVGGESGPGGVPGSALECEPAAYHQCEGECANDEVAAVHLTTVLALVEARGFADVFVPLQADYYESWDGFVAKYQLARPGYSILSELWVEGTADLEEQVEAQIDAWPEEWLAADLPLADGDTLEATLLSCHADLVQSPDGFPVYRACNDNGIDFRIEVSATELDGCEARDLRAIVDARTGEQLHCGIGPWRDACSGDSGDGTG